MRKHWKHIGVVLLLLLLAGEAGMTMAAGLRYCDGRCGCCDQLRHGANRALHTMAATHHEMGATHHQMGADAGEDSCCTPTLLPDCVGGDLDAFALITSPPRMGPFIGQILHLSAALPARFKDGCWSARDPFMGALLSRSTIPLYLQTAVFLC